MDLQFPVVDDNFPVLLPPLGKLIDNLADCDAQVLPLNCAEDGLRVCDIVLSAFFTGFKHSIGKNVLDEREREMTAEILGVFARLGQIFTVTYRSVRNNERELTIMNVIAIVESLRELEGLLREQREYRYAKPKFSTIPGINAVLEAGNAVLEGIKPWDFLVECLERMRPAVEKMCANPYNPPYVQEHCEALKQLFLACSRSDGDNLPAALEAVKVTGEAFMAERTSQQNQESDETFACPMCGSIVERWAKKCPHCNAKMPDRSYELEVVPSESFELPGYLSTLNDLAEALRQGNGDWGEFALKVREIQTSTAYIHKRLGKMATVTSESSGEERDLVVTVHDLLQASTQQLEDGVQILVELSQPLDLAALDNGMELLVAAIDNTRQATLEMRRLEKMRGNASNY